MPCPLREIRLRRSLDPVRTVAVEDLVDVRVQDPALRLLTGQLDRETRLRRLSPEGLRRRLDVEVARELLRDRRAALHDVAGAHVGEERTDDAGVVERTVRPVPMVLDGDGRSRHPLAHAVEVDRLAVFL